MGQEWFYTRDGAQQGPVDADAIRRLIAAGQLGPSDYVWREGMPQWLPAANVPDFYAPAQPQYAAPPPPHYGQPQYGQPQYGQPQYGQQSYGQPPYAQQPQGPAQLQYRTPLNYAAHAPPYAGFWTRFCAAFIDGIILNIGQLPIAFALNVGPFNDRPEPGPAVINGVLSIVIAWLYGALQESSTAQATLGKRALGIVVTDERGGPISFGQATGRHFGKLVSGLILGIGFLMAAFTEKKQGLHDMMAGTLVVRGTPRR